MEDTKAFTLKYGKNNSWFCCHIRFLYMNHTYRCGRYGFRKNTIENKEAIIRLTNQQIWDRLGDFQRLQILGNPLDQLAEHN